MVVLLSDLDLRSNRSLARTVEGIDLILGTRGGRKYVTPEVVGKTAVTEVGTHGRNVGLVRCWIPVVGASRGFMPAGRIREVGKTIEALGVKGV